MSEEPKQSSPEHSDQFAEARAAVRDAKELGHSIKQKLGRLAEVPSEQYDAHIAEINALNSAFNALKDAVDPLDRAIANSANSKVMKFLSSMTGGNTAMNPRVLDEYLDALNSARGQGISALLLSEI